MAGLTIIDNAPPSSVELEAQVLGIMIAYPDFAGDVFFILHEGCFYDESHRHVFNAIKQCFDNGSLDIMLVYSKLRENGKDKEVGGLSFLTGISGHLLPSVVSSLTELCEKIYDDYLKRNIILLSSEVQRESFNPGVPSFDLIRRLEHGVSTITADRRQTEDFGIFANIPRIEKQIENRAELTKQNKLSGVNTGFDDLNKMLGGYQPGDLVIIAARPSMGKTAIALHSALAAVKDSDGALFFSLEMTRERIIDRIVLSETNIPRNRYANGMLSGLDKEEFELWKERAKRWTLDIPDGRLGVDTLKIEYRRIKKKKDIKIIFIDYLTLMDFSDFSDKLRKDEKISAVTKALKQLAKEERIPIVLLAQLNRESDKRGGSKRPMLADLKESGAIEEDADVVLLLYRAEYYGITSDDDGASTKNIGEIIIAKHRNGNTGTVKYRHDGTMSKFYKFDKNYDEQLQLIDELPPF